MHLGFTYTSIENSCNTMRDNRWNYLITHIVVLDYLKVIHVNRKGMLKNGEERGERAKIERKKNGNIYS
jgi:hypothetical protein